MRDRLLDLLPLLLVSLVLLAFYFLRNEGPGMAFQPVVPEPTAMPTPTARTFAAQARLLTAQPGCTDAYPTYIQSMALIKAALGTRMGEPLECERAVDASGDTQQRTTSGLAYYRKASNIACFTTGWDHWALRQARDLVYWTGDAIEPPVGALVLNS